MTTLPQKKHGVASGSHDAVIELYGCKGCGSAAIEALLEWAGLPYAIHDVEPWKGGAATEALARINPMTQVPTMRLADGSVLTETAAMIVVLAEQHPAARLLPPPGDPARIQALRWIVFLAGNVYPAISVGDFPERWIEGAEPRKALKQGSLQRLRHCWTVMEHALKPAPYLISHEMSALDVYAAMFSHWRPGRAWIEANCPHVAAALALTERQPFVARAWQRNFQ